MKKIYARWRGNAIRKRQAASSPELPDDGIGYSVLNVRTASPLQV